MADFGSELGLEEFRTEARAWLEENFPASLRGKPGVAAALMEGEKPEGDVLLWMQRIGEKGWGTPTWPTEYGGGGLSGQQARVLQQEMAKIGAFNPLTFGMGVTMVGPTILDYGTEEQKRKHIPPIVRGEIRWCVGYSEPNAGSDWPRCRPRRPTPATTGRSRARRPGPRGRSIRSGAARSCGPTPRPRSMTASPSC